MATPAPASSLHGVSRGVFPPSFCQWRALLGVSLMALLAVGLIALGIPGRPQADYLLLLAVYAQGLGLFCALVPCLLRAWLRRLPTRDAWLMTWLAMFVSAIAFSYVTGVVGTVLGFGPGQHGLAPFMLKSVLAVAIVAAALFRYLYIRLQWEAETLAEAEARVQALQARIRPHFLFNSLNTIASLIPVNPEGAERATEDLADLFRGSMRRADQPIRLQDELQLGRKYLQLEGRRLGERLRLTWRVDELPGQALVPPMILQPLLENAVNHGIQPLPEGGELQVYGRAEGGNLVITISNPMGGSTRGGHGMALNNIRARLELAFGTQASLVTDQDRERFYAVLTLPYAEAADHR